MSALVIRPPRTRHLAALPGITENSPDLRVRWERPVLLPLPAGALESPLYEAGVSCPRCHAHTSETQKNSARERQKQWELAKTRAQTHIGAKLP